MARDDTKSSGGVDLAAVPISKKVYVHDPALPRSARTDSKSIIVVTNRNRVRFEKLQTKDQYDYEMKIDAVEMRPPTWRHAGLPPDGAFAPKYTHDSNDPLQDLYSYDDEFMILVTVACNLVMHKAALSDHDRKPEKVEVRQEPVKPLPPGETLVYFRPPGMNIPLRGELDEDCMTYVLGMLVRLFYLGDGETGKRCWSEQELRKAVILYLSGTDGTSQFTNFTSLFMSLEHAVYFVAESTGAKPNGTSYKHAADLLGVPIYRHHVCRAKYDSGLVKKCCETLGSTMARRVDKYRKLNNPLKHYENKPSRAKSFYNNITDIEETIRNLRVDAAHVILLGLVELYGTNPPARTSKTSRTSQIMLNMIEDCVDRHCAKGTDGGVEAKMQWLMDLVEDEAVKSKKVIYDDTRSGLNTLEMLVRAARMLGEPDGSEGVRKMVREYDGVAPDRLKPSKYGLTGEYDEETLHDWLVGLAHDLVVWMDGQFRAVSVIRHIAQYGMTSDFKCDPGEF